MQVACTCDMRMVAYSSLERCAYWLLTDQPQIWHTGCADDMKVWRPQDADTNKHSHLSLIWSERFLFFIFLSQAGRKKPIWLLTWTALTFAQSAGFATHLLHPNLLHECLLRPIARSAWTSSLYGFTEWFTTLYFVWPTCVPRTV